MASLMTSVFSRPKWEGEGVIHLRFAPLHHSIGRVHDVLFTKDKNIPSSSSSDRITVLVLDNENVEVYYNNKAGFQSA